MHHEEGYRRHLYEWEMKKLLRYLYSQTEKALNKRREILALEGKEIQLREELIELKENLLRQQASHPERAAGPDLEEYLEERMKSVIINDLKTTIQSLRAELNPIMFSLKEGGKRLAIVHLYYGFPVNQLFIWSYNDYLQ